MKSFVKKLRFKLTGGAPEPTSRILPRINAFSPQ
jgi:hypothetical protein